MFESAQFDSKKSIRYCAYARVSSEAQGTDGTSLESQKSAILDYIRKDPNGVIDEERHIFVDDTSGLTDDRPSFRMMVDAVKRREFDVIIVLNLDRFFRKLALATKYLDLFRDYGVKFKSINQPFDTTTPVGEAICQILFVFANMEAGFIAARTKLGKKTNAESGKYVGGSIPPYGYKLDGRTILIDETEAAVVRRIFDMYVTERKRVSDICAILTAENAPIRSVKKMKARKVSEEKNVPLPPEKNLWTGSLIYSILENTIYYGKYFYGRTSKTRIIPDPLTPPEKRRKYQYSLNPESEWVAMESPRIIGDTEKEGVIIYDAAKKIREENRNRKGKRGDYAFSGKIISDLEGHYTYAGSKNRNGSVVYKIHQSKAKPNFPKKVGIQVLEEEIVEAVMEFLKELINTPSERMMALLKQRVFNDERVKGYSAEIAKHEKRLREIDVQISNLVESLKILPQIAPDIRKSMEGMTKEREVLSEEIKNKRSLVDNVERAYENSSKVKELLLSFKANIDVLSYETKKDLAKSLVEKVWVDLDRHYRFELTVTKGIEKYFNGSDGDDHEGPEKPIKPKRPRGGPKKGSNSGSRGGLESDQSLIHSTSLEGGQNIGDGVINLSPSPIGT